jgi:hypothetical protein
MRGTLLLGVTFTRRIPNVHLAEFEDALQHGEVLLMVDVVPWRVTEVESLVHRHPEAVSGGVGWHSDAFGIQAGTEPRHRSHNQPKQRRTP